MDSNTDPTGLLGSFVPQPGTVAEYLRFPGYRWGYLPVVLCQKLQKGLTQRWLLNLCQMLVLEIDHAKSVAFSL